MDKFVFGDTMIDEGQVRELATGKRVPRCQTQRNLSAARAPAKRICIGVASAICSQPCARQVLQPGRSGQPSIEQEKAASGRSGRLAETLLRYDGHCHRAGEPAVTPVQPVRRPLLLFHLISKLYENTSLLITTNPGVCRLAAGFGDSQDDDCHARPPDAPLRHRRKPATPAGASRTRN